MRRYKRYRYGPGLFRPWRPFRFIWLIILGMLFFGWRWWPGIIGLFVLLMVLESVFRASTPGWPQNPPPPPFDPSPPPFTPTPFDQTQGKPVPAPVTPVHRTDLLPATCPQCGGPIRAHEVTWTGAQSAACPFCGSNLPMKKW